uniref:C2H2-type domain-containing protein n=1 Tax=Oryzias latipes TaxID=8090 RepID=A0A3P9JDG2_ORYLA
MFSVQYFRELISDRLTVAALDIFAEFEKTIMQYEEAMERQRRLLTALRRKPATAPQLCPADLQQYSVQRKEEAAHSPPPQQSPSEPLSFPEGLLSLQLVLKQEPEDSDGYEPDPHRGHIQSDSHGEAWGQKPQSRELEDATSAGNSKLRKKRPVVDSRPPLEGSCSSEEDEKLLACDLCDKTFKFKSLKKKHDRVHKGGKRHFCKTCGKGFTQSGDSLAHSRTHVRRRRCPFREHQSSLRSGSVWARIRNHNLWRRFSCKQCGKNFVQSGTLLVHRRVHTGEKPFS